MPRTCTICIHPARLAIEQRLEAGHALRDVAGQYALSKSALDRHKASHVPTQFAQDGEDLESRLRAAQKADQWHYKQLRWNARAVMRAMQGWAQVGSPKAWQQVCDEARRRYHSGEFLLERLGAERLLDPQLMATLWQLRQRLIEAYGEHSPAATMLIDLAVMTYYNALRVQGWMGDLALWIEHECFAQEAPRVKLRRESGAHVEGLAVEDQLRRLSEQLVPLFERANRQLIQNLKALAGARQGPSPLVAIRRAEQVNVAHQQVNAQTGRRHRRERHPADGLVSARRTGAFPSSQARSQGEQ
jgi:hypothetical protein